MDQETPVIPVALPRSENMGIQITPGTDDFKTFNQNYFIDDQNIERSGLNSDLDQDRNQIPTNSTETSVLVR